MKKKPGNPYIKPIWNNKSAAIRLPEKYHKTLRLIAEKLDSGEIDESELRRWIMVKTDPEKHQMLTELKSVLGDLNIKH